MKLRIGGRRLTSVFVTALSFCGVLSATSAMGQTPLWDASCSVPAATELRDPAGVEFRVIKRHEPEDDKFDWLHGVALAWHGERLFASYGHNQGKENTASEMANYSVSTDGGQHWSAPKLIDDGQEENLAVSHGVFLNVAGRLWVFHGAFFGRMQHVHTRAYSYSESTNEWTRHGVIIEDGFWPMQEPQRMADGNWVMAGLQVIDGIGKGDNPAAVAISHGDDLLTWDLVSIQKPEDLNMWGESTVVVDGENLLNVSRWRRPKALVSSSHDFGRTWTTMTESNLPMAASKPYAGVLSTGHKYLIGNMTSDNGNRRGTLTIAISDPQETLFRRLYRIRGAIHDGPGESHASAALSYPYAIEHDGKLYVGYSNDGGRGGNRNSAELAIIPIESLTEVKQASARAKTPTGIASRYIGDRGIAEDPRVVFAENFEQQDLDRIAARWDTVRNRDVMSLSKDVPVGSSGTQSLLIAQRAEKGTGGDLYRVLGDGHNKLYTRMYVRFAEDCEPLHHFGTCVGGNHPATRWPSVRAGQPTKGDKSFWVGIEPFGKSWQWDYYAYWCEMRGSPPRGQTWGNSFIHDDTLMVRRGKWTCVEVMVKMNDVDKRDGELALWIDGRPVSHLGEGFPQGKWIFDKFYPGEGGDGVRWNHEKGEREYFATAAGGDPFEGFRFRTAEPLNINFVWLYVYITKGTRGHANRVWFDDVVVATDYIGPLRSQ